LSDAESRQRQVGLRESGPDEGAPGSRDKAAHDGAESFQRRWTAFDIVGLAWVVMAGALVLTPALVHGTSLGPYDILQATGITSVESFNAIHNHILGDQIRLFIPWTDLVWTQVHHGQLPLWNPYSALGAPLAFNWQSAPMSLPVLVGYLLPLHLAYTAQFAVTVVVGGTGVYVLGKVLGLSPLGCTMAATVFELSGTFIGWLGWPSASVMSWAGWIFAATVLILRGGRRVRNITFFAVVLAFATYAGDPEELLIVIVLAPAVFALATLLQRTPVFKGSGPLLRPVVDFAVAGVAGLALAAPLILPGLQLARKSKRISVGPTNGPQSLPFGDFLHLIFQGFDGLPLRNSDWFGFSNYAETAMYVGVIAVVLAILAVAVHWGRPELRSFTVLIVAAAILVFVPPLISLLDRVIGVYWVFALQPMVMAIAVLCGMGMDVMIRSHRDRRVRRVLGVGFGAVAVFLAAIWLPAMAGLSPRRASIRAHSFIWPAIEVVVGLAVVWGITKLPDRTKAKGKLPSIRIATMAAVVLLACESGFLIASGAPIPSSSTNGMAPTPVVAALKNAVGNSVVGFGVPCDPRPQVGLLENANILFGVHEMAVSDPMTPRAYYAQDWGKDTGQPGGIPKIQLFCPIFNTASLARLYGVGYVLTLPGHPGPTGAVYDARIGPDVLYKIPDVTAAYVARLAPGGAMPAEAATGTAVDVTHPDDASWRTVTDAPVPEMLRMHLTNVPGWHATVNGRPLKLVPFGGVMLQARLPAGHDVVVLRYWPDMFSDGLMIAAAAIVALLVMGVVAITRARLTARRRAP
jgi:hypothetical protein